MPIRLPIRVSRVRLLLSLSSSLSLTRLSLHFSLLRYAQHATDFIARRSRLSFLNVNATIDALPRVIEIMGKELGWDAAAQEVEFDRSIEFLKSMGLQE